MKKRKLLVSIALASSYIIGLASCGNMANTTDTPVGSSLLPTSVPVQSSTSVEEKCTITFETNCETKLDNVEIKKGGKITEPAALSKVDSEGRTCEFKGWFTDSNYKHPFDFNSKIDEDITLYGKWFGYEEVSYSFVAEKYAAGTISNKKFGQYTVANGEVVGRNKIWYNPTDESDTLEWQKSLKNGTISFTAPGDGKVIIYIQNGSSGASTQKLSFKPEGQSTKEIKYAGSQAVAPYPSGSPVVAIEQKIVEGQKYTISSSGTSHIFEVTMNCTVKETDINGFVIDSIEDSDYLVGESFDKSNLHLLATYENGKTTVLDIEDEDVLVDNTNFDNSKSGTCKLSVKYCDFDAIEFDANVWEVESINLGFNKTYLSDEKTSARSSQYINGKTKKIYAVGEALNTDYLSVTAIAKLGTDTKEFLINERESVKNISYDSVDTSSTGVKEVTVNYNDGKKVTAKYNITVTDTAPVKNIDNVVMVNVDSAYTGVAGEADNTLGNRFTTIGEALEYLGRLDANEKKIMNIAAGTYNEKLEITVPNLTINGLGASASDVLIEWDSLWGVPDEGGFYQVTDSLQTVAVRESAVNCVMNNITISNWWNSEARFNDDASVEFLKKWGLYTTKVNEHRAVALLVQSDKFVMNSSRLLGYQDTVQFQKGRQVINNSYISGTTDYIFGTNNTTLFKSCEIHTIYNGGTDGGYTTAFKGCTSGVADSVEYGAIFYQCTITKDSEITASNTSLGRTWGQCANVAYINCEMGEHISKTAYNGASKNQRYVAMQGFEPTTSTVKFVEYGNTGTGAISASIAGVTYISEDDSKKYYDYSIIFGRENGHVSYLEAWDPTSLLQ